MRTIAGARRDSIPTHARATRLVRGTRNASRKPRCARPLRNFGAPGLTVPTRFNASAMKFRSNNSVAISVPDLRKAETFYSGVLGFRLLSKTPAQLEYDTGRFLLHVHKAAQSQSPVPSFTVIDTQAAKTYLEQNGCEILADRGRSLHFRDPFGFVFDVIED